MPSHLRIDREISDFLVWAAGGRRDVLRAAPGGRGRLAAMGGVIVSTAALAAVSATFAMHMALAWPYRVATIAGIGWGVVILNLDRMLVIGMGHERSWKRNLGMAIPRFLLAVVLGTVISTPLTLQIFHGEIGAEMVFQQQTRQAEFTKSQAGLTKQIANAQKQIGKDRSIVDGGAIVDPDSDPRVVAAQRDVNHKQAIYSKALASYQTLASRAQCEYDGTCGTRVVGDGPQYRAALRRANGQKTVANEDWGQLQAAQRVLVRAQSTARSTATSDTEKKVADAKRDLATTQSNLTSLSKRKAAAQASFQTLNAHDTGLLSRLEALEALANDHFVLRVAQIMLTLLFLSVEILPVLMKLLLNMSSETAYEKVARRVDEQENIQHAHLANQDLAKLAAQDKAATVRHSLIVSNERDRVDRQLQVLKLINTEVTEAQLAVVRRALEIWTAHAARESERILHEYEQQVNGAHVTPSETVVPPSTAGSPGSQSTALQTHTISGNRHNGTPTDVYGGTTATRLTEELESAAPTDSAWLAEVQLPPEGQEV